LGSAITKKGGADEDVKNQIKKAYGVFIQFILSREINIFPRKLVCIFNTNVKSILFMAVRHGGSQNRSLTCCRVLLIDV
jgi:hypothetical protein